MTDKELHMLFVGGSKTSYRCQAPHPSGPCGCNVFEKTTENPPRYVCNACGARWVVR